MFKKVKDIFFVGIGGIGASALAKVLHETGFQVSGSDFAASEITQDLELDGLKIMIGHRGENLPHDCDLLIYSAAVPPENPERLKALDSRIPQLSYPEALGQYAKSKNVIAVAGTNGKTTTAAMIATVLLEAGFDPTVIIGSKLLAWNSNARLGRGSYLVLEADEYRRAFLNYFPAKAVVTNIEADHLDYFRDIEDVKLAFSQFLKNVKSGGTVIYNLDNANCREVAIQSGHHKISFGFTEQADFYPDRLADMKLQVPGSFNLANAMAAAAVCHNLGIELDTIIAALNKFTGTWRRFQNVGKYGNTTIISDYAHHPDGITVTLESAHDLYQGKRVLVVFQPHQHNRTKNLFREFVESLASCSFNHIIISEIFDVVGREAGMDQDISSKDLVAEIKKSGKEVEFARDLNDCEKKVRAIANAYDVVIFMGAGDIYKIADKLVKN